jgi:hypothetical protein
MIFSQRLALLNILKNTFEGRIPYPNEKNASQSFISSRINKKMQHINRTRGTVTLK